VNTTAEQYIQTGLQYTMQGDSDRAEYFFLKAYEIDQNAGILSTLGWFYGIHLARMEDGFKYFRRAIRYNPKSGDPYNECGNLLFRAGLEREALKWFHKSISCKDNSKAHYVLYNLAVVYNNMNRPERSIQYLNQALSIQPAFKKAEKFLADLQNKLSGKMVQNPDYS
jgi:Tfp pilus assembly protein PilF